MKVNGFAPHGGVLEQVYGNGLVERTAYNGRLQVTRLRAGVTAGDIACGVNAGDELCLEWGYGADTANNGNVMDAKQWMRMTAGGQLNVNSIYGYDSRNRLKTFTETKAGGGSWGQTNSYDGFGNRWSVASGVTQSDWAPGQQSWIDAGTNRVTVAKVGAGTAAVTYDVAGNMIGHPQLSGGLQYDVEGRQTAANGASYVYDGEGRRVKTRAEVSTTALLVEGLVGT